MHISIVTGTTTTQLADAPVFKFDRATVGVLGQQVTVTPAIDVEVPQGRYVSAINGVASNDKGEFFIDGSACDSWMLGTESDNGWVDDGHTISIVDLCPACTTCESIYRLQYEAENLKMWINTLKDVSLYMQDDMEQRRTNLSGLRVTGGSISMDLCANGIDPDDAYMQIKSAQLMQQYMTVVHMWNYVVSQNNSSNEITVAPEDTAGFVVQTKRALPSCGEHNTFEISCQITVGKPKGISDNTYQEFDLSEIEGYDVSVYIPEGSMHLDFEPFDAGHAEELALNGVIAHDIIPSGTPTPTDLKIVSTCRKTLVHGVVTYEQCPIKATLAGTYVVTAKFLPYIHYKMWRIINGSTVYVSVRGGTATPVTPVPVKGGTIWDFGIAGHTHTTDISPTEADYLEAKTSPTCSVNFKLKWPIQIVWTVRNTATDEVEQSVEDYVYLANGIRTYYGDAIVSDALLPDPVEEPEPEPNT